MDTYVAKVQIGNNSNDLSPIASTLFGVCNTNKNTNTKVVTLTKFDKLIHGVTLVVKFAQGNAASSNVKLQVGETLAYDVLGNCTCGENEVISFTFDEVDATHKYWHAHTSGMSSALVDYITNLINTSTEVPDVLIIKGSIGAGGNPGYLPTHDYETGWTYVVVSNGTYAGQTCTVGDLIIAINNAATGQSTVNNSHWTVVSNKILYTNGEGLNLNGTVFSVDFGTTAGTVAEGDHNHNSTYALISHSHGNINSSGKIGMGNALLRTIDGEISTGPTLGNDANKFLNNTGAWATVGNVTGPNSSTDEHVPIFDGATGKILKDSGFTIESSVPPNAVFTDTTYTTDNNGVVITNNVISLVYGNDEGTVTQGNDPRLSDARTPVSHVHGNITNAGYVGSRNTLLRTTDGLVGEGPILGNDSTKFLNNTGAWTLPPVTSVNGETGDVTVNAASIGVGEAVHFIGKVASDSVYTPSDETNGTPTINGWAEVDPYSPVAGDIVIDKNNSREYIYTTSSIWELLGLDNSDAADITYDSDTAVPSLINTNIWISRIKQWGDRIISVERATLDTSGSWTGDAAKLGLSNVGSNIAPIYLVAGVATQGNTYAGGTKVTLNDIDLGADTATFYAPEEAGSANQILISGTRTGYTNPQWTAAATIVSDVDNTHETLLTLGNNLVSGYHSHGSIKLYSTGTGFHVIEGASTNSSFTHTLQNEDGFILQSENAGAVGGITQPIYINSYGLATALTYTANRLYYSESTSSFAETDHYATDQSLFINKIPAAGETISDTFYVNGNSTFNGNINISGLTHIVDTTDITTTSGQTVASLVVDGGMIVAKQVNINDDTAISETLSVTGHVGLGGSAPAANDTYVVEIYGDTLIDGNLVPTLGTNNVIDKTLGTSNDPWAAVFIENGDHGDPYTPVYWYNGVPTVTTPAQRITFTFNVTHNSSLSITHSAITDDTEVSSIVVTHGLSYLNSEIEWNITTFNSITSLVLTANTTLTGTQYIEGYVTIIKTSQLSISNI